jgi:hypothetical protein
VLFSSRSVRSTPLATAIKGTGDKFVRYVENYDIDKHDVIPLVFETYGGYSPVTFTFLKEFTLTIAQNDEELAGKLFRSMRDRVAVALHTGHAEVISQLNGMNYISSK